MHLETNRRSMAKAVSYRLIAVLVTSGVALLVTAELKTAAAIGVMDMIVKVGIYYFHERFWSRIDYGRIKPPEYEI